MRLSRYLLVIFLPLLISLLLPACGYHLRGSTSNPVQLAESYKHVQLIYDDKIDARIADKLTESLLQSGISPAQQSDNQIKISQLKFHQLELVGVLSEVQVVLNAQVDFKIQDRYIRLPLQVMHSYQLNEAAVTTNDQQGLQVRTWLQDILAEQIAQRYYALATH